MTMTTEIELNEYGEQVEVTTLPSGTVIRTLARPAPHVQKREMFKADIMRRVSASEWASLEAATDPYSRYLLAVFNNIDRPLDPDDPHVVLLFQSLEVLGHVAAGRAAEMLA